MDDIDKAQANIERDAPYILAASKKPVGPQPNGRCHFCDELVGDEARFCDVECARGWEREATAQRRAGK